MKKLVVVCYVRLRAGVLIAAKLTVSRQLVAGRKTTARQASGSSDGSDGSNGMCICSSSSSNGSGSGNGNGSRTVVDVDRHGAMADAALQRPTVSQPSCDAR